MTFITSATKKREEKNWTHMPYTGKENLKRRNIKQRILSGKDPKESLYREVGGNYPPLRQVDIITVVLAMYTGLRITC